MRINQISNRDNGVLFLAEDLRPQLISRLARKAGVTDDNQAKFVDLGHAWHGIDMRRAHSPGIAKIKQACAKKISGNSRPDNPT
jgi:hypothetical protein